MDICYKPNYHIRQDVIHVCKHVMMYYINHLPAAMEPEYYTAQGGNSAKYHHEMTRSCGLIQSFSHIWRKLLQNGYFFCHNELWNMCRFGVASGTPPTKPIWVSPVVKPSHLPKGQVLLPHFPYFYHCWWLLWSTWEFTRSETRLGYSIWITHSPCGRFNKYFTQWECEYQVDKLTNAFLKKNIYSLFDKPEPKITQKVGTLEISHSPCDVLF